MRNPVCIVALTRRAKQAEDKLKESMMNKTFSLLISAAIASTAIALGLPATAVEADAHGRYYGQYGYYDIAPRFHQSPTYAPDRRPPRSYNNPGRRDSQLGSRG
jgi:hypothetical protein